MYFNPRSPDGERPSKFGQFLHKYDISIHAPRMGSDRNESACPQSQEISIHAPRMGSDVACGLTLMVPVVFQSTLPGWGATVLRRYEPVRLSGFQSTLPGWGATRYEDIMTVSGFNFNPRSPDGERLVDCSLPPRNSTISIHAPRMGSDVRVIARMPFGDPISIHAPRMGSDRLPHGHGLRIDISIHAPRMGSD